ncbi:scarecrow-like protein 32-like [Hibiscus syriacus]|uniref:Scarecrow-like protein 32-like n=1 Tax=Hibiscus syriacus TaxID=106335 RepID=A0A6A2Y8Q4_HIBSY|nr:fasciclin-like arabinogalactan protein 21 [Hibiscus syriacus]KAE8670109.1 scarecrow-like protein 32-like [Hibiscus syriacus]
MACSWWRAPVYFTVSVLLAFLAISTALRSLPRDESLPTKSAVAPLLLDASTALRKSGFNIIATLLQITPEIFISSPHSTIFAIPDSSIANASHASWLLKHLFQYHASPLQLPMKELLKKHKGSCFPTLFHGKNVALTKVDDKQRIVEINRVLVSHPDIFLDGPLTIHGVLGPFTSMDPRYVNQGWDHIQAPICDSNLSLVSEVVVVDAKNVVEWTNVIRLLSSKGFVSFAIGLNSVLDGILYDKVKLNSVTVFAPPEFSFVASASALLEKIVRLHIVPRKLTYMELASLPANASLSTLVPGHLLRVSEGVKNKRDLMINEVKIVAPNLLESKKFVIHGISQAFELDELPNISR